MAPKSKPTKKKEIKGIEVRPTPDPKFEMSYPRYYSNYVAVHGSPFDFTLRFCDALPLYDVHTEPVGGIIELKIPIKAEIVIPKELMPNLIKTMQDHYEKYIKISNEAVEDEKKS